MDYDSGSRSGSDSDWSSGSESDSGYGSEHSAPLQSALKGVSTKRFGEAIGTDHSGAGPSAVERPTVQSLAI
jgi:hypothetical protein